MTDTIKPLDSATLQISLDAEGAWADLAGKPPSGAGMIERIGVLDSGTTGGKRSVAILVRLDDGEYIFAETTLALFQAAARTINAKFPPPEPTDEERAAAEAAVATFMEMTGVTTAPPALKIYQAQAKITGRIYWLNAHDLDEATRFVEYCAHDDHGGHGKPTTPVIDTIKPISAATAATIGFPANSNERSIGLLTILDASRAAAKGDPSGGVFTCNAWWTA